MAEYITIDEAFKALNFDVCFITGSRDQKLTKQEVVNLLNKIRDQQRENIVRIKPADVRENIHARWESDGHGHIVCTACKNTNVSEWKSRICPLCGAIMDGERRCEDCYYHTEKGCKRWTCIDAEVEPKGEKGET